MQVSDSIQQIHDLKHVNAAFSKQAEHYDTDDINNPILQNWRKRVYSHVNQYLEPNSHILELNAGTGIDAAYFVNNGHQVHATDLSDGMIEQIKSKIDHNAELKNYLTCKQCSFTNLESIEQTNFDFVFSNFGGLNCSNDLASVTSQLKKLIKPKAYITFVIMPKITPWEWLWTLKGQLKKAFRRLNKDGVTAHLENEYFKTYYYSITDIKKAFGKDFEFKRCEALGIVSPPPGSVRFYKRYKRIATVLEKADRFISMTRPFNQWGDHIITTFQYAPKNTGQI